jgi:streptogramin lyase
LLVAVFVSGCTNPFAVGATSSATSIGASTSKAGIRGTFKEFSLPKASAAGPLTAGPDGALWFTEGQLNKIGRMTLSGVLTEFPVPTSKAFVHSITAGFDGNLWFTERDGNNIGRITPAGVITEFPIPTPNSAPQDITSSASGGIWFVETLGLKLGEISATGRITEYPLFQDEAMHEQPTGITIGLGSLSAVTVFFTLSYFDQQGYTGRGDVGWFSPGQQNGDVAGIGGRLDGALQLGNERIGFVVQSANGDLWLTEPGANQIARVGVRAVVDSIPTWEYRLPNAVSTPTEIINGPDGNVWFDEYDGNRIGRIVPSGSVLGEIKEYTIPTPNSGPGGLTVGPDGAIWFSEGAADKIGRLS